MTMHLAELKRVDRATVWKAGRPAASLERTHAGVTFAYRADYAGPAIASTLARDAGPIATAAGALPPVFSGLLPEGRRLTAIRRATKTSADDELTLLLAVGADTIGDVQVLPEGHDRAAAAEPPPIALGEAVFHELKLDPPEVPHLVANEAFFLRAARDSGLEVADATVVHDRLGHPGLCVRRFDRVRMGDTTVALAQEDACQVLARYPADKYRLTTEEVIVGLSRLTTAPVVAARTLLRQFAFAYLTGNGDAHAKNFSVVRRDAHWEVAPAYDMPSSLPYGDTTMALSIGGKDREDLGRRDFLELGAECGVLPKAMSRVLDELLAAMPKWIDRLAELPFDARVIHKLERACRYRAKRLQG